MNVIMLKIVASFKLQQTTNGSSCSAVSGHHDTQHCNQQNTTLSLVAVLLCRVSLMLIVTYKPLMLNVVTLSVVAPCACSDGTTET
jgi:hypothetical protein